MAILKLKSLLFPLSVEEGGTPTPTPTEPLGYWEWDGQSNKVVLEDETETPMYGYFITDKVYTVQDVINKGIVKMIDDTLGERALILDTYLDLSNAFSFPAGTYLFQNGSSMCIITIPSDYIISGNTVKAGTYMVSFNNEYCSAFFDPAYSIKLTTLNVTNNGAYIAPTNKGYSKVNVDVEGGGGYPEPTGTIEITSNGTHDVKDYAEAEVNVPEKEINLQTKLATENGTYTPDEGYDGIGKITVAVEGGYPEPTGAINITTNGAVNVKDFAIANVDVNPTDEVVDEILILNRGNVESEVLEL